MTDCIIRSRIAPHIKEEAKTLFNSMGLTLNDAIRIFLFQSVQEKGIPFSINLPNAITRATIEKVERDKGLNATSLDQLSKDWDKVRATNNRN
jgi:DNA-damage-inducible protein J